MQVVIDTNIIVTDNIKHYPIEEMRTMIWKLQ